MEQTPKTVRKDAQKIQMDAQDENREQELLRRLIRGGVLELKPALYDAGVHYTEAEEILRGSDSTQVKGILQSLEKKGALKSKFMDRVLICPDCGSSAVYSKYTCPKCNSHNVEYTELLEHMKCGYMDSKDNFTKGSSLVCPSCQTHLTEEPINYHVIGNCYQCEKCGYRFDKPEIIHLCKKCRRTFTYQDAKYVKIFTYQITDKTVNDLGKDILILENIKKNLTDKGFKVQLHPKITGDSGVRHSFDILAEKNEIRLVIDISVTGGKNDMISLLGKKFDVNPTGALIIDLSNLDELTQLEKEIHGITVLKTTNKFNLPNFEKFLAELDSTKAPPTLRHVRPSEKEFVDLKEKPIPEYVELQKKKKELENELQLLDETEKILQENLKILEEKSAIQVREEKVKAKLEAIDQLESRMKAHV